MSMQLRADNRTRGLCAQGCQGRRQVLNPLEVKVQGKPGKYFEIIYNTLKENQAN